MSDWQPNPEDWFDGKIVRVHKNYLLVELDNDETVFCAAQTVHGPGKHQCILQEGDDVLVQMERNESDRPGLAPYKALYVHIKTAHSYLIHDAGEVCYWADAGTHGAVIRDCGCHIFCRPENRTMMFSVGERVSLSVVPSQRKGFIGINLKRVDTTQERQ
jgi:hypothetical protein